MIDVYLSLWAYRGLVASVSEYPFKVALVQGDPVEINVDIRRNGVAIDASQYAWRAQVREFFHDDFVVAFHVQTITPPGGLTASTVRLTLTPEESRLLRRGQVFDLEQLDLVTGEVIGTWWVVTRLNVQPDVSYDEPEAP